MTKHSNIWTYTGNSYSNTATTITFSLIFMLQYLSCLLFDEPWPWLIHGFPLCKAASPHLAQVKLSMTRGSHALYGSICISFSFPSKHLHGLRATSVLSSQGYLSFTPWNICDVRQTEKNAFPAPPQLVRLLFKGIYDSLPWGYLFIFSSMTTFPVMSLNISNINPSGNKIMQQLHDKR